MKEKDIYNIFLSASKQICHILHHVSTYCTSFSYVCYITYVRICYIIFVLIKNHVRTYVPESVPKKVTVAVNRFGHREFLYVTSCSFFLFLILYIAILSYINRRDFNIISMSHIKYNNKYNTRQISNLNKLLLLNRFFS